MKNFLISLFAIIACVACSESGETDNGGGNNNQGGSNTPTTPTITLSKSSVSFDEFADEEKITFSATADWIAEIVNDRADSWLSISPKSGTAGDAFITIKANNNDTHDERNATVIIKAGSASKTINVSQKQKDALTVTSSKFEVGAEGGEVKIEIKANINFEYEINESAKDWIKYEGTRAMKTSTLAFKVAENDDTKKREGKIAIKSGEFNEVVTIYQVGSEPSIVISQNEYVVSSDGETIAVEVTSNVDVVVEIAADVDWISENTTRASSTNTYRFDIQPSEDYNQRTAEIRFTNKDNNLSEVVTVTQTQKDALVVAKDSYTVDSQGDQIQIEVGHNIDFDIEISADWITREQTRAFTTETLVFNIAKNPTNDNREGAIVFKSKDGKLTQTVKVYQAQEDALIISKKDIVVSDEGGTISFELQTNVDFKVSDPDVDWMRAVVTRGLTTHTLHYEYDANSSYDSREAHIVVTDTKNNKSETITITQTQKDAIVLAKDSYVVESEGGQIQIEVGHNIDFNVEISADWITKVDTRAFVTETLNFNIAKNPTNNNREGAIIFTSKNNTLSQKLKIIQNPHELQCVYVATKGTLSHILNELGLAPCDIHEIKISGYLNDEDFLIIREDMSSLEYLDISDVNITTLPAKALYKSTSIKTLLLPKTLLEIRGNVFAYSHIQEVVIPQGVSRIGDSAFYNCDYLSSISFPSSVEVIEPNAFADCSSLYNIKFEPESKIRTIDGEFIVRDISTANNPYKYEYEYNGAFANCDKLGLDPISKTHIPIFFLQALKQLEWELFMIVIIYPKYCLTINLN